jgi:hypothetical protein
MEQRAICIETLADLVAHGYGINALCEKCRHRADLDMQALIAKLGADFVYLCPALEGRLVCRECGSKEMSSQIHYLHSNRSRFAD